MNKIKPREVKITKKQIKWCYAYMDNDFTNTAEAARVAGYAEATVYVKGHQNRNNPKLIEFMGERLKKMEKDLSVNFDWKIKKLKKIVDVCVDDNASSIDDINPSGAIGAISELNKMQGHYSAEKITTTNINVDVEVQQATEILERTIDKFKQEF